MSDYTTFAWECSKYNGLYAFTGNKGLDVGSGCSTTINDRLHHLIHIHYCGGSWRKFEHRESGKQREPRRHHWGTNQLV